MSLGPRRGSRTAKLAADLKAEAPKGNSFSVLYLNSTGTYGLEGSAWKPIEQPINKKSSQKRS